MGSSGSFISEVEDVFDWGRHMSRFVSHVVAAGGSELVEGLSRLSSAHIKGQLQLAHALLAPGRFAPP